jgi:hypothetical protein
MLVLETPQGLRLVTQHDHARLAHDLLSLWTADGLPELEYRPELLLATAQHDSGWQGADAAPLLNNVDGRPFDFRNYPDTERRSIWRETTNRFVDTNPSVALLLHRHAERIHEARRSDPDWHEFFASLSNRRSQLEESHNISTARLDLASEYLWLADLISLGACGVFGSRTLEWQGYALSLAPLRVTIDPFPYAGALELRVACRHLPRSRYSTAAELAADVLAARWEFIPVRIEPR